MLMMKQWLPVAALAMAAMILGTAGAGAQQPPAGGPGGERAMGGQASPGFRMRGQASPDAIKTILDLDERQYAEMVELRQKHQDKLKEYSDEQRSLEQEKRAIVTSTGADPAKIGSITLRQEALTQMIQQQNDAYHTASLGLLTATQRDKVKAIEEAIKLAPNAGALMQFGLIDTKGLFGNRSGGFMGMAPGQTFRSPGGPSRQQ